MRDKIKLVSSAGTGHYYTTDKNKKTTPDKLVMKKYDQVVRKHVEYKEAKIKKSIPCYLIFKKPAYGRFFMSVTTMLTGPIQFYRS